MSGKEHGNDPNDAAAATALHGRVVDGADRAAFERAAEQAVNYRGDVTIIRRSDRSQIEGYVFDIRRERDGRSALRIIPRSDEAVVSIHMDDVEQLVFSGKDTAAGKSFETWVKKYVEKRLKGERASIESEPLTE